MESKDIIQLIVLLCSVFAVIIPLGVKLYKTTRELVEQKNWPRIVEAVSEYMIQAEILLSEGADRKEWVMAMVKSTADQLNYTLTEADLRNISDLIDELCEMSKVVNPIYIPEQGEQEIEEAAE